MDGNKPVNDVEKEIRKSLQMKELVFFIWCSAF
jgi:hypothetical protein